MNANQIGAFSVMVTDGRLTLIRHTEETRWLRSWRLL
jgi:hypothetical protein